MPLFPLPLQKKKKKKASDFTFSANLDRRGSEGENVDGFGERLKPLERGERGGWKDDGKQKPNQGQNQAWKRALIFDTWCSSFFLLSPFLSFTLTYTWESRQLMCCLWWQREAYINRQKTPWWKGREKRKKMGRKCLIRKNGNSWWILEMEWW